MGEWPRLSFQKHKRKKFSWHNRTELWSRPKRRRMPWSLTSMTCGIRYISKFKYRYNHYIIYPRYKYLVSVWFSQLLIKSKPIRLSKPLHVYSNLYQDSILISSLIKEISMLLIGVQGDPCTFVVWVLFYKLHGFYGFACDNFHFCYVYAMYGNIFS